MMTTITIGSGLETLIISNLDSRWWSPGHLLSDRLKKVPSCNSGDPPIFNYEHTWHSVRRRGGANVDLADENLVDSSKSSV